MDADPSGSLLGSAVPGNCFAHRRPQKLVPRSPMKNKGLLSSIQAPKPRSFVGGRKTHRQSPKCPLCSLPSWETSATSPAMAARSSNGDYGPQPGVAGPGGSLAVCCWHAVSDSSFASHQPWSSVDLNRPVPESQLCCGTPCLSTPSYPPNNNWLIIAS